MILFFELANNSVVKTQRLNMQHSKNPLNQTIVAISVVVGAVVLSAVVVGYTGKIQLHVGADGIQVHVDGGGKTR
jgi:hypothetical protein